MVIARQDLMNLMKRESILAVKMLWSFVQVLSDRLRATNSELSEARQELAVAQADPAVRRRMTSAPRRVALGVLAAAVALRAHADVFDTYGFGPRATAMGGAMTAEAKDYTAVFYNPALLMRPEDVNVRHLAQLVPAPITSGRRRRRCRRRSTARTARRPTPIGTSPRHRRSRSAASSRTASRSASERTCRFSGLVHVDMPDPNRPFWYHYQSHSRAASCCSPARR